jgi:hypothetical protein
MFGDDNHDSDDDIGTAGTGGAGGGWRGWIVTSFWARQERLRRSSEERGGGPGLGRGGFYKRGRDP